MIKYDFNNKDLWFTRRALQELACADRLSFGRHIKRIESSAESKTWRQDEIYLFRVEGGRKVRRRSSIFDLETSYLIMSKYQKGTPPDYWCVLSRFEELIDEKQKGLLCGSEQDDDTPKKRVILDYWDNKFNLATEGEDDKRELWPRSMFRFQWQV